jgi:Fis family transcriptional regulator, factor for inversion stimulation protein
MTMRAQLEALVREMVDKGILYEDARREFERRYILYALEKGDGNIGQTSELIGMHRNTLSRKIAEYDIKRK